jgi:GMP synthase (glutamine-hydrolysing)
MQILIIDLGSQYALVIGRTLRELGYRSAVLSPKRAEEWLSQNTPKCVILSGGDKSVYEEGAPKIPEAVFSLGVPVLGIC